MIKVRVRLDGNDFGYVEYKCDETMEEYLEWLNSPCTWIGLTETDTKAFISIPKHKYVIEAWAIDE